MMERRIYILFISLLTLSIGFPLFAQNNNKKKTEAIQYPLYNGTTISADLYGLGSKMLGSDFLSSEISIDVSLKNRYFPVLEAGYGTTDTSDSEKGIAYKSGAPFFRIGMNYNTMYKKKEDYFLYVGLRYGFSSYKYDITTFIPGDKAGVPSLTDPEYGGVVPFNHSGLKGSMQWMELLLGVRVTIYGNIKMGWTIRMKNRLTGSNSEHGVPWYVPGFGKYDSSNIGLTYSIIYKLPF